MRIFTLTSNGYEHCHVFFNRYQTTFWPYARNTFVGYEGLTVSPYPHKVIGKQQDYTFSSGLKRFLMDIDDEVVLLMLEDYFITEEVDNTKINTLVDLIRINPLISKIDLSGDRVKFAHVPYAAYKGIEFIKSTPESHYQSSLQAAIWRKSALLSIIDEQENAWQFEKGKALSGVVIGTKKPLINYINAVGGEGTQKGIWQYKRMPMWMIEEINNYGKQG